MSVWPKVEKNQNSSFVETGSNSQTSSARAEFSDKANIYWDQNQASDQGAHPRFHSFGPARDRQIPTPFRPPLFQPRVYPRDQPSTVNATVLQQTVRVPSAPRSCPPCSPVTRIRYSLSADGAVSPGVKTVTFEVTNDVSDDHINLLVQSLKDNLEKGKKQMYEEIPLIQLKAPPKGKGKRPLSSDSDSFSSDLASSSISLNSSTTSDSFPKLLKSPDLPLLNLSYVNSPKKLKSESDASPSRFTSSQPDNYQQSLTWADEKKCVFYEEDQKSLGSMKNKSFNYSQMPASSSNVFCSTPLKLINPDLKKTTNFPIGREETSKPSTGYSQLEQSTPVNTPISKNYSAPFLEVEPMKAQVVSASPGKVKPREDATSGKSKAAADAYKYQKRSPQPDVFIFPDVRHQSKYEDEVDGFEDNDSPMEMDVDGYDDGHYHYDYRNGRNTYLDHGQRSGQSQVYQQQSWSQPGFHWPGPDQGYAQAFDSQKYTSGLQQTISHPQGTFQRSQGNYFHLRGSDHDLMQTNNLGSGGFPISSQAKTAKPDSSRTAKQNRSKVIAGVEDILDVSSKDDLHVLSKFNDPEVEQQILSAKQDVNNNQNYGRSLHTIYSHFGSDQLSSTPVSTKANTNVCLVPSHELPDSDYEEMDHYDDHYNKEVVSDFLPGTGYTKSRQRCWDETDGCPQNIQRQKKIPKSPAGVKDVLHENKPKKKQQKHGIDKCYDTTEDKTTLGSQPKRGGGHYVSSREKIQAHERQKRQINSHNYHIMKDSKSMRSPDSRERTFSSSAIQIKPGGMAQTLPQRDILPTNYLVSNKVRENSKEPSEQCKIPVYQGMHNPISRNLQNVKNYKNSSSSTKTSKSASIQSLARNRLKEQLSSSYRVPAPTCLPLRTNDEDKTEDESDDKDEVDGFGEDEEQKNKTSKEKATNAGKSKQDDDDIVHCFDDISGDEVISDIGAVKLSLEEVKGHVSTSARNVSCDSAELGYVQSNQTGTVSVFIGSLTQSSGDSYNCSKIDSIQPSSSCSYSGLSKDPNVINLRTTGTAIQHAVVDHQRKSVDTSRSQQSIPFQLNLTPRSIDFRDDATLYGRTCEKEQKGSCLLRRASDSGGLTSSNLVLPRARSSPSKLEHTSGDNLAKGGKHNFHRPWVSPENPPKTKLVKPQENNKNFNKNTVLTSDQLNMSTTSEPVSANDTRNAELTPKTQTQKTAANVPSRFASRSEPIRFNDSSLRPGAEEHQLQLTPLASSPFKRCKVERRLNFENTSSNTPNSSTNSNSLAKKKQAAERAMEKTETEVADFESSSANSLIAGAKINIEAAENSSGAAKCADANVSSISDAEAKLRRLNTLMSRADSGSSRRDNEIDVRLEISDSMVLSERLEQIYQANDRRCECARIEQEILSKALELFKELCDPNKRYENWKMALKDTNAVIRDSLDVADSVRQLCCHGRTVTDVFQGSVILRLRCSTLMSVADLCRLYASGELHVTLNAILCRGVRMGRLALKVTIDRANVQGCVNFLLRTMQDHIPVRSQNRRGTEQRKSSKDIRQEIRSSPSTPSPRVHTQNRCFSSPALYTQSPTCLNPADNRERTFSFGETRLAFQDLRLSDKDSPTSPLGSSSRWNSASNTASSPLTPLRVSAPFLFVRTSPMTSPVTSPRKLKRHDVIQEQENIGGENVT